jgi:acyl carrier protein
VRTLIEVGVHKAAQNKADLSGEWEPRLDSIPCVAIIVTLEELLGELPPEKLVQRGGYETEEEAVRDMCERVQRFWCETHNRKGGGT